MTIKTLLYKNKLLLKKHNIKTWQIDAELILCFVLNKTREYLITRSTNKLSFLKIIKYKLLIHQRIKGYSVAAIIGIKSFYGRSFIVDKKVLVPRPETEIIVDTTLTIINSNNNNNNNNNNNIIDIGCGSGCIIITIAKECNNRYNKYFAIDISKAALSIARKNIIKHHLSKTIKTLKGNILTPILKNQTIQNDNDIIITANLPYLTIEQVDNSPSIKREPRLALVAEEKGLKLYRELLEQVQDFQKSCNNNIHILCEIDPNQSQGIKELQKKFLPSWTLKIKKDLAQQDRLAIIYNMKS